MFRCELWVFVETATACVQAIRWVELPFVPMEGMELGGLDAEAEDDWDLGGLTIQSVRWMHASGYFSVGLRTIVDKDEYDHTPREEAAMWLGDQWTYKDDGSVANLSKTC
jgi:hypothetical protein